MRLAWLESAGCGLKIPVSESRNRDGSGEKRAVEERMAALTAARYAPVHELCAGTVAVDVVMVCSERGSLLESVECKLDHGK